MLDWFMANLGTIIIAVIVFAIVGIVAVKMLIDRKKGKSSCGCGCSNCPMSGKCHSKEN
ncbi:MAG: FeoB-associated Cys-rich membrane protein [Ruminococcus sp.]|nr:FeoB-associated Cys-rich membrane protein [Ruminococcus sp.]